MAGRFYNPITSAFDANGNPISGAKLEFFESGTTTPLDTFSDDALTTANTNPVIADSAGRFGTIFLQQADYKAVLSDADDVVIWTEDPVRADAPKSSDVREVTTATVLDTSDDGKLITADATAGAFIITLPAAATAANGYEVTVQKIDSGTNIVTVDASGAETINGVSDLDLPDQYASATFRCDGTTWYASAITPTTETRILPPDFVQGFLLTSNSGDAEHDLDISTGNARSDDDTGNIILTSAITKQIDAAFAEGTNQGGLDTGTVAADTRYFVWVIGKPDRTGDALFSLSKTSPTLPSGFIFALLRGSVQTDSSSNIDLGLGITSILQSGEEIIDHVVSANMATLPVTWDNNDGWSRVRTTFSRLRPDVDDALFLRTSADGGATFDSGASDYAWVVYGRGSGALGAMIGNNDGADSEVEIVNTTTMGNMESTDGNSASGIIEILQPGDASSDTAIFVRMSMINTSSVHVGVNVSAQRLSEAAVNGFQLFFSANNIAEFKATTRFYK